MMKYFVSVLTILLSTSSMVRAQENIEEGKTIFRSRCASCHAIDKRVIGPALKDVEKRHSEKWIVDFVHSSQSLINQGDEAAVKLFSEYNKTVMPDHKDLSETQIKSILAYIKEESLTNTENSTKSYVPEFTKPYENKNGLIDKIVYLNFDEEQKPIKPGDTIAWLVIATIIILLIVLFYLLTFFQHILDLYTLKKGLEKNEVQDQDNINNR